MVSEGRALAIQERDPVGLPLEFVYFDDDNKLRFVNFDNSSTFNDELNNVVDLLVCAAGVSYEDALLLLSRDREDYFHATQSTRTMYELIVPLRTIHALAANPLVDLNQYMFVFPPNVLSVADFLLSKLRCFQYASDPDTEQKVGRMFFGDSFTNFSACISTMLDICGRLLYTHCTPQTFECRERMRLGTPIDSPSEQLSEPQSGSFQSYTSLPAMLPSDCQDLPLEPLPTYDKIQRREMCYVRNRREYVRVTVEDGKLYMTSRPLPRRIMRKMLGYADSGLESDTHPNCFSGPGKCTIPLLSTDRQPNRSWVVNQQPKCPPAANEQLKRVSSTSKTDKQSPIAFVQPNRVSSTSKTAKQSPGAYEQPNRISSPNTTAKQSPIPYEQPNRVPSASKAAKQLPIAYEQPNRVSSTSKAANQSHVANQQPNRVSSASKAVNQSQVTNQQPDRSPPASKATNQSQVANQQPNRSPFASKAANQVPVAKQTNQPPPTIQQHNHSSTPDLKLKSTPATSRHVNPSPGVKAQTIQPPATVQKPNHSPAEKPQRNGSPTARQRRKRPLPQKREALNDIIRDVNDLQSITLARWLFSHVLSGRIHGSDDPESCSSWFPKCTQNGTFVYEPLRLYRLINTVGSLHKDYEGKIVLGARCMGKVCMLELDINKTAILNVKWRDVDPNERFSPAYTDLPAFAHLGPSDFTEDNS